MIAVANIVEGELSNILKDNTGNIIDKSGELQKSSSIIIFPVDTIYCNMKNSHLMHFFLEKIIKI